MKFLIYGDGLLPPNMGRIEEGGVLKLVGAHGFGLWHSIRVG